MQRRRTNRGERSRSVSVKALGQMFEELIRLTQTVACSACAKKLSYSMRLDEDRDFGSNGDFARIDWSNSDKTGCGQCNKSTAPSIDGILVKNRKQFFEGQVQVPDNTKNAKHKTDTNIAASIGNIYSASHRLDSAPYGRSKSHKEPATLSVKSRSQLFKGYVNGGENDRSTSPGQGATPNYRSRSSVSMLNLHDYTDGTSNSKHSNFSQKYGEKHTDNGSRRKSHDVTDRYDGDNKTLDWKLSRHENTTTNIAADPTDEKLIDLDDDHITNPQNYENLLDHRDEPPSHESISTSSEENDREFIAYENLPPPPPQDLLKTLQNDAFYRDLFPTFPESKHEDDIDEAGDKPVEAKLIEIDDDGAESKGEKEIKEDVPQKRTTINIDLPADNSSRASYAVIYENLHPSSKEVVYRNVQEEDPKIETQPDATDLPKNHIEKCISNVAEAFQSIQTLCDQPKWQIYDVAQESHKFADPEDVPSENIQTLCDQPKWHVWDVAQQSHKFPDPEDDSDIFGPLLDIDSDYCVETFNNGNENVLFRISIGREVLMQENEDYGLLSPIPDVYDEVEVDNKDIYEESEYYSIGGTTYENEKDMSGIFFDKNKNPRIEIIGGNKSRETFLPELNIPKLQHMIIKELIDSEENYLKRMKYIIDNYLIYFREMGVSGDIEVVFGNVEEIHSITEKIYSALKESVSVDEIARAFLANVHIFDCYTEYLRNKSRSQQYATKSFAEIIQQRQLELEDQYTCESYLLNTTHRPEQYKLILERLKKAITKNGESCESLDEAILLIDKKIAEINTALAVDSIKFIPCSVKEMGAFLMKEKFNIKKKYTSMVFLFQGGVVFCVEDQSNSEEYEYVERIEMDKLLLRHCSTSTTFQLSCYDKSKKYGEGNHDFDLEAPSMTVKEKWVDEIQRILWCQLQYYKDQLKYATLKRSKQPPKPQLPSENVDNNEYEYIEYRQHENGIDKEAAEEEEPQYCDIEDTVYDSECGKMSGTFFDKDENPRIEIIRAESVITDHTYMQDVPKSQYMIIKELINTEETYLRKMKHIIDEYYHHFKNAGEPPEISLVFGNIENIYEETEQLYSKLLECNSVEDIANVFLENVHIFDLYTDYLRNKSISFYYANTKFKNLIKERQIELEDQYTCDSYLLNPVQRPGRYRLLLEKLDKELNKTGETCRALSEAVRLVADKITEANTLMTIDSIKKCPIDLKKMGPFIMKETFSIKRKFKSVIFLFRDIVVFCTEHQHRPDTYVYSDSIEMTQLSICHNRSSTSFQLRNFDKSKLGDESKCAYTFDVEAPSMSVKEKWIDEVQRLLWGQLQYFKDQQKRVTEISPPLPPIRKGSLKKKAKPYDVPSRNQKRSTFYYDIE